MHRERSPKPRLFTLTTFVLLGTLLSAPAFPHGGGLNSSGCHNDNVNGGYHCHRDGDGEDSLDADVVLAALVVAGIVYLVYKQKKKRSQPTNAITGLPLSRVDEVSRRDPVTLGLTPVTNSRGGSTALGCNSGSGSKGQAATADSYHPRYGTNQPMPSTTSLSPILLAGRHLSSWSHDGS